MKELALQTKGYVALVDDEDFAWLSEYRWYLLRRRDRNRATFYARTGVCHTGIMLYMHKLLVPDAKLVDHRDGNGLNNQRANLRPCPRSGLNTARRAYPNATGFRGVHAAYGSFIAKVKRGGKQVVIGRFSCPVEAARAYDEAAIDEFGEFAVLNFPGEVAA